MSSNDHSSTVTRLSMSSPQLLQRVNTLVKKQLEEFTATTATVHPSVQHLGDFLTDFAVNGGKRIRPTFMWAGYLACVQPGDLADDDPGHELVLSAACSLELIQACALIHDDIIDQSLTRRGASTVHVQVAAEHSVSGWKGSAEHYGVAQAILLGDLALSWSDDTLVRFAAQAGRLDKVLPHWSAMKSEVLAGQMLDVWSEASDQESLELTNIINAYKTAAYTVTRPLLLGSAFAGASAQQEASLQRIGSLIGEAFQLRDDQLGVFGDPQTTGKPAGDDIRTGKRTRLVAEGLRLAEGADRDLLSEAVELPCTDHMVEEAKAVLIKCGAVHAVEDRIAALSSSAQEAISGARFSAAGAELLSTLVDKASVRQA